MRNRTPLKLICARCGQPRELIGHVCPARSGRAARRRATPKPRLDFGKCPHCKRPLGNPLTHTCKPRSDFKSRKRKAGKAARLKPKDKHDYLSCGDRNCPRSLCVAYKTGWREGYRIGFDAGYAAGYSAGFAAGQAEGYDKGFAEGLHHAPGRMEGSDGMVTFMEHVLAALGALLAWCAFVYFRPRKRCQKCNGWGSGKRRRRACGRCQATGRTMRLSARLVHGAVLAARAQLREAIEKRQEARR
jgi:hypothetical protein